MLKYTLDRGHLRLMMLSRLIHALVEPALARNAEQFKDETSTDDKQEQCCGNG